MEDNPFAGCFNRVVAYVVVVVVVVMSLLVMMLLVLLLMLLSTINMSAVRWRSIITDGLNRSIVCLPRQQLNSRWARVGPLSPWGPCYKIFVVISLSNYLSLLGLTYSLRLRGQSFMLDSTYLKTKWWKNYIHNFTSFKSFLVPGCEPRNFYFLFISS